MINLFKFPPPDIIIMYINTGLHPLHPTSLVWVPNISSRYYSIINVSLTDLFLFLNKSAEVSSYSDDELGLFTGTF